MSVANVSLGQTRRIFCCPRSYTSRRFFGHSTSSKTSQSGYPEPAEEETITHTPQRFSSRPHPTVERIIRVSHAGEFGADRIYAGQAAVLRNSSVGPVIQHMQEQEKAHLEMFSGLVERRRVRPSALMPVWDIAGYVLGAGSALLGKEAAMACTVAVEEAVAEHYNSQLRELLAEDVGDEELLQGISECRDEELEHKHIGLDHSAQLAAGYEAMSEVIKAGCRAAIWMSERV